MRQDNILIPVVVAVMAVTAFLLVLNLAITAPKKTVTNSNTADANEVACIMDAKVCPDGSSVGRVPPKCEFADCPATNINVAVDTNTSTNTNSSTDATAGWKTHESTSLGFRVKYPTVWIVSECGKTYVAFDTKSHRCETEYGSGFNVKTIESGDLENDIKVTKADWQNVKDQTITIDGRTARRISGTGEVFNTSNWYQDIVYVATGGKTLVFHYLEEGVGTNPRDKATFDNFISTLTFTK